MDSPDASIPLNDLEIDDVNENEKNPVGVTTVIGIESGLVREIETGIGMAAIGEVIDTTTHAIEIGIGEMIQLIEIEIGVMTLVVILREMIRGKEIEIGGLMRGISDLMKGIEDLMIVVDLMIRQGSFFLLVLVLRLEMDDQDPPIHLYRYLQSSRFVHRRLRPHQPQREHLHQYHRMARQMHQDPLGRAT
jgi:hypothetical protein